MGCRGLLLILVVACTRDVPNKLPAAPRAPAASGAPAAPAEPDGVRAAALSAHIVALSADDMRGRAPGSDGHRKAERYVADQLARVGVAPAFEGGYLQEVPLRAARRDDKASTLTVGSLAFEHAKEVVLMPSTRAESIDAEADVMYVGFGVKAPEYGHDDLDGVDTRGRILVVLQGAPARFPPLARAIYGLRKPHRLRDSGAAGLIVVMSPEMGAMTRLANIAESQRDALNWYVGDVPGDPEMPTALVTTDAFDRMLAAAKAGTTVRELYDRAAAGTRGTRKLGIRARLRINTKHRAANAANVVGVVPGTDPARAHEMIIITAHLDHLGVGTAVGGDEIYNGAVDNAFGVALLLELARVTSSRPTARTIVFAAVTAEETGMGGSSYLARHPPGRVVANINLDPMGPLDPVTAVQVIGAEQSSFAQAAAEASKRTGIAVAPPIDNALMFMLSDQYNFIRANVPAVYPTPVHGPRDTEWKKQHWHKPSDTWNPGSSTEPLAQFGAFVHALLVATAEAATTPSWNADSLFRNHRW